MTLKLQVIGGLASRMRALVAAKACAEFRGTPLVVNWPHRCPTLTEEGGRFKKDHWAGGVDNMLGSLLARVRKVLLKVTNVK